jgi:endo-1,4-beta-xylanase
MPNKIICDRLRRFRLFRRGLCAVCLLPLTLLAADPSAEILLWPNGAPGSENKSGEPTLRMSGSDHVLSNIHKPSITPYLPATNASAGAAVIVIPGGNHLELWVDREGGNVAQWLSQHGIAAFMLKYRLAKAPNSTYTIDGDELADIQRAIRLVRSRADEWSVKTNRIGVIGFSAGGEVAFLSGMHFDRGASDASDPIDRASCRPDFQALIYPIDSNRIVVATNSPPAFLACGNRDSADISEELANVYLKFKRAKVPAELHIFDGVGHGFGVRPQTTGPVAHWPDRFYDWLDERGFLKKS